MTAITDMAPLDAITHGEPELQRQVLADLRRIDTTDVALLRRAMQAREFQQADLHAHRIKGAAMTLGARELAEACSLVAQACRMEDRVAVSEALALFERRFAELEAQLAGLDDTVFKLRDDSDAIVDERLCHGLRFLVVEDHEFQLRIITGLLRRLGAVEVHGAQDAALGLKAMADPTCAIDIAVLDLSMPGMDGMDLMRSLSSMPHGFSLILNSALSPSLMASLLQMTKGYRINLLGAIGKPLTTAKLAPLIAAYRRSAAGDQQEAG